MRGRVALGIIGWLVWPVAIGAQSPRISGPDVPTFEIGFPLPPDRSAGQIDGYHYWA